MTRDEDSLSAPRGIVGELSRTALAVASTLLGAVLMLLLVSTSSLSTASGLAVTTAGAPAGHTDFGTLLARTGMTSRPWC